MLNLAQLWLFLGPRLGVSYRVIGLGVTETLDLLRMLYHWQICHWGYGYLS